MNRHFRELSVAFALALMLAVLAVESGTYHFQSKR